MTKPSFRFFIIPLGAICTLASLTVVLIVEKGRLFTPHARVTN